MANQIQKLVLRAFVSFEKYTFSSNIVSYRASWSARNYINSTSNVTGLATNLRSLNMTGTPTTFAFFTGFILSSTSPTNIFDVGLVVSQLNSTAVRATLYSRSSTNTYISTVYFVWYSFNPGFTNRPSFGNFSVQSLDAIGTKSLSSSTLLPFNVMWGLSALSLTGNSLLMSFQFTNDNKLNLLSGTGLALTIQIMSIQTYFCPYNTFLLIN